MFGIGSTVSHKSIILRGTQHATQISTSPAVNTMKRLHVFPKHFTGVLQMQGDGAGQILQNTAREAPALGETGGVAHLQHNKKRDSVVIGLAVHVLHFHLVLHCDFCNEFGGV